MYAWMMQNEKIPEIYRNDKHASNVKLSTESSRVMPRYLNLTKNSQVTWRYGGWCHGKENFSLYRIKGWENGATRHPKCI